MKLESIEVLIIGVVGLALVIGLILSVAVSGPLGVAGAIFGAILWIVIWTAFRMRSRSDATS